VGADQRQWLQNRLSCSALDSARPAAGPTANRTASLQRTAKSTPERVDRRVSGSEARLDAVALITLLGYPEHSIRFIGTLKLLGVAAILVGRYPMLEGSKRSTTPTDSTDASALSRRDTEDEHEETAVIAVNRTGAINAWSGNAFEWIGYWPAKRSGTTSR